MDVIREDVQCFDSISKSDPQKNMKRKLHDYIFINIGDNSIARLVQLLTSLTEGSTYNGRVLACSQ